MGSWAGKQENGDEHATDKHESAHGWFQSGATSPLPCFHVSILVSEQFNSQRSTSNTQRPTKEVRQLGRWKLGVQIP
jgi:hypothetical protein